MHFDIINWQYFEYCAIVVVKNQGVTLCGG
jgi:hypothetical protein